MTIYISIDSPCLGQWHRLAYLEVSFVDYSYHTMSKAQVQYVCTRSIYFNGQLNYNSSVDKLTDDPK